MIDKDYSPHECWCDTQNNISDRCNCMVSSYIEKIDEMRERIERLETALNEIANCGATLDGVVAFSMKQLAREALDGEKK